MPTENATSITELDPTRPADTEPVGEGDDHINMFKGVIKNTFVDQPGDAWDDAAPLSVGPRTINGWEARIAANEAAVAANTSAISALDGRVTANEAQLATLTQFKDGIGPAGQVLYNSNVRVEAEFEGMDVRGNVDNVVLISVTDAIGGKRGQLGYNGSDTLRFANLIQDANLALTVSNIGGQVDVLEADGNGVFVLRHPASEAIIATGASTGLQGSLAPTNVADLTRKDYVDGEITTLNGTIAATYLPLAGGTLTGAVSGVTPSADAHLTRKDYIDGRTECVSSSNAHRFESGDTTGVGSIKIQSGVVLQAGAAIGTENFPEAFGAGTPNVILTPIGGTPAFNGNAILVTVTNTGFTWNHQDTTSDLHWIAFGRRG